MLARLGHHAFVGGDHEHGGVDAADAGQHVLDKVDMAGHVDDADAFTVREFASGGVWACRHGKIDPGKAQIDGHAARFFFLEPVGVDAAEGPDQRGLAVVDVAGGADDAQRCLAPLLPAIAG